MSHHPTRQQIHNSRNKGKSLERQVAKMIAKAFKVDEKEVKRTPMSGAWGGKQGDIVMSRRVKKAFPWTIECKNQKSLPTVDTLIAKKRNKTFQKCWEQAVDQAVEAHNFPILIWRSGPSQPIMCAIPAIYPSVGIGTRTLSFEEWSTGPLYILGFKIFLYYAAKYGKKLAKEMPLHMYTYWLMDVMTMQKFGSAFITVIKYDE
jgi:hypothetical protein